MFIYKYCSKCKKRNHKANNHCVRCGDELTTAEKFGKGVFVMVLSFVILLSSATVFASKSYFSQKSNNAEQPVANTKTIEPTPIEKAPEATTQSVPTATTPITTTPKTTTKTTTTPATTPAPVTQPVTPPVITCDEGKKYSAIDVETIAYNGYVQYENTRYNNQIELIRHDGDVGMMTRWANEDKKHADNLAQLEATHTAKLAEINARCY